MVAKRLPTASMNCMLNTTRTISSRYRGGRCRIARVSKLYEAEQKSGISARKCECEMFVGIWESFG